jgi:Ca2+-binding EF-hand superfamily protein
LFCSPSCASSISISAVDPVAESSEPPTLLDIETAFDMYTTSDSDQMNLQDFQHLCQTFHVTCSQEQLDEIGRQIGTQITRQQFIDSLSTRETTSTSSVLHHLSCAIAQCTPSKLKIAFNLCDTQHTGNK